jgi:hypothetical protein
MRGTNSLKNTDLAFGATTMKRKEDESKIAYHIRSTKKELKQGFYDIDIMKGESAKQSPRHEFGASSIGLQVIRHYVWIILKLSALYLAHYTSRLIKLLRFNKPHAGDNF